MRDEINIKLDRNCQWCMKTIPGVMLLLFSGVRLYKPRAAIGPFLHLLTPLNDFDHKNTRDFMDN
jgi:hypothetical protein